MLLHLDPQVLQFLYFWESLQQLVQQYGCTVCHSTDGSKKIGPTWKGLAGSQVTLSDSTQVTADQQYLVDAIKNPNQQIPAGFSANVMPDTFSQILDDSQIQAIVTYIQSLK